jgi:hypothetical protein
MSLKKNSEDLSSSSMEAVSGKKQSEPSNDFVSKLIDNVGHKGGKKSKKASKKASKKSSRKLSRKASKKSSKKASKKSSRKLSRKASKKSSRKASKKSSKKSSRVMSRGKGASDRFAPYLAYVAYIKNDMGMKGGPLVNSFAAYFRNQAKKQKPDASQEELNELAKKIYNEDKKNGKVDAILKRIEKDSMDKRQKNKEKKQAGKAN